MKLRMETVLPVIFLLIFGLALPVVASETEASWKSLLSDGMQAGEMTTAFSEIFSNGGNVSEAVAYTLDNGGTPYETLKSAFMAEADVRSVIRVALSRGISSSVIAKAALDAGLDMKVVAGILSEELQQEGLAYTPLPGVLTGDATGGEDSSLVLGVLVGSGSQAGENVSTSTP